MALTRYDKDQNGEVFPTNWREMGRLTGVTLPETDLPQSMVNHDCRANGTRHMHVNCCRKELHTRGAWEGIWRTIFTRCTSDPI